MKRLCGALLALCLAGAAHAQSFRISSVQVQPGFFTAGVRIFCAGTLDTTATLTCQLYVQKSNGRDASWYLGTQAFRRTGFTNAFDGILIGLTSGQAYGVKVTVANGGQTPVESSVSYFTTRSYTFSCPGPQVFVSPSGADAGTCTSASPCASIYYAEGQLVAKASQGRGGAVVLRPGVYRTPQNGAGGFNVGLGGGNATPDSMYHLMGDGTNPDSTIIDCTEEKAQTWLVRPSSAASSGDSTFYCLLKNMGGGTMKADSVTFLERGWGDVYPQKENLTQLFADKTVAGIATGARGWCHSGTNTDTIIVKTPDGASPGTDVFHLGYRTSVLVSHPYWAISNLTVRGGNQSAITFGIGNGANRGNGTVLDSVRILVGNGSGAICDQGVTASGYSDSVLVRNCTIDGHRGHLPLSAFTIPGLWGHGIQFAVGFANTAYNNTVIGNAFGYEGFNDAADVSAADSITSSDNYVGFNRFVGNVNSGMDCNGNTKSFSSINAIFENNLIRGVPSVSNGYMYGISAANTPHGPQWLIRNHVYACGDQIGGASIYAGSTGAMTSTLILYHNTIVGRGAAFAYSDNQGHVLSRNNIYAARYEAGDTGTGRPMYFVAASDALVSALFDFDYDLVDGNAAVYASLFRWGAGDYSLAQLRANTGKEAHGVNSAYSPIDSTRTSSWPAAVTSGSAANVDAGVVIPGINTILFGKPRYYGTAPDIGAYEWIAPTDSLHMPLNPNNRLWIKK